jgi:hypothetical protein
MAGTGHKYEISNPTAVKAMIMQWRSAAIERGLDTAVTWLNSKHLMKFITGEAFTFRLKPGHVLNSSISVDPEERRKFIVDKIVAGEEVRRFDPELFEALGPGIPHILDWVADLKASEDPLYGKVARMETPVLVAKADAWTKFLNKKAWTSDGETEAVLSVSPELTWFELKDSKALSNEGYRMGHCVGSQGYDELVRTGRSRIYSLRTDRSKPILTAEVRYESPQGTLIQIQKRANGGLPIAYCEAASMLLNAVGAVDRHSLANRYALVFSNGSWTTIYDEWHATTVFGRQVLTDGCSLMFMCSTDPAKPLAVVEYSSSGQADTWFDQEFDADNVRFRLADDLPPLYRDQVEACDLANLFFKKASRMNRTPASWMAISQEDSFLPLVDTYERVQTNDCFFYKKQLKDDTSSFLLPHSQDPARILMTASKGKYDVVANVATGQKISRVEVGRCLAFMTATNTRWISEPGGVRSEETDAFRKLCLPVLLPESNEWRSFAADLNEAPATRTSGKWHLTDYLLRYYPNNYTFIDIHIANRKMVSDISGGLVEREHVLELVAMLRKKRLTSEKMLRLTGWGDRRSDAIFIFTRDGKWVWTDNERTFSKEAIATVEAISKTPFAVSSHVLDAILTHANVLIAKKNGDGQEELKDIKSRLLPIWFMGTQTFDQLPFHRAGRLSILDDVTRYPVIDRLISLADIGFDISSRRAGAQFRKFLKKLSVEYGRGRVPWSYEAEYEEFVFKWYLHLPQKYLNKVSPFWSKLPSWLLPEEALQRILEIISGNKALNTKFRSSVYDLAERILVDADYAQMSDNDLSCHARLFLVIARTRYLYGSRLASLGQLVEQLKVRGTGDPDTSNFLIGRFEEENQKEQLLDKAA